MLINYKDWLNEASDDLLKLEEDDLQCKLQGTLVDNEGEVLDQATCDDMLYETIHMTSKVEVSM